MASMPKVATTAIYIYTLGCIPVGLAGAFYHSIQAFKLDIQAIVGVKTAADRINTEFQASRNRKIVYVEQSVVMNALAAVTYPVLKIFLIALPLGMSILATAGTVYLISEAIFKSISVDQALILALAASIAILSSLLLRLLFKIIAIRDNTGNWLFSKIHKELTQETKFYYQELMLRKLVIDQMLTPEEINKFDEKLFSKNSLTKIEE